MARPWLTIIGLGEDGLAGLSDASRTALAEAELVFGGPRHLALAAVGGRGRAWPVPFETEPVLAEKGRKVVVLASGDPFWYGAGGSLAARLDPSDWQVFPAPSTFSLAAARLGWRLEEVLCLGLHAAPFERLVPLLAKGVRIICLVRDGAAAGDLARWLSAKGFGASALTVLEALGGPRERLRRVTARDYALSDVAEPVAVAISAEGAAGLQRSAGLPDAAFASDGQITKRPIRALTLSALAPRPGEVLWDLGAGSGSVSVEWCLAACGATAEAVELRDLRRANVVTNSATFGLSHRIRTHGGAWPDLVPTLPAPDAVFVGGGADERGIETILPRLRPGARLVVNAVTLETEMMLASLHLRLGGTLMRFEISEAAPLGRLRGWLPARPVIQWSFVG